MTQDVLSDGGTAHGSFAQANWGTRPAAGKTGTTQDYKSLAFLGFTPFFAGASIVWDYLSRPQPICKNPLRTCSNEEAQAGAGMTGGAVPAKTWADTMVPLHANLEPLPFPPASAQYQKGSGVHAIDVVGKSLDEARTMLAGAGYSAPDENIRTVADPRPVRTVIDQWPKSDAVPGGIFSLTVSGGPAA
jgi:membrane peptidoglycan carboxypeptidase